MTDPFPGRVSRVSRRLRRSRAVLLVVDIQERLWPAMHEADRVLRQAIALARGAAVLEVPVLVTEQYRKGLGCTVPALAAALAQAPRFEKLSFSGCIPEVATRLGPDGGSDVILCGIESHVCVAQTALDLMDLGHRVFVVTDATSSRTPANWQGGVQRMGDAGAIAVTTEMVLFELLERAGTAAFKEILSLVK